MARITKEEIRNQLKLEDTVYETNGDDIFITDRQRKDFDSKALEDLKASIQEVGLLQPGLCFTNREGQRQLIAGERRLRACKSLGVSFRYQLVSNKTDSYVLSLMELSENLCRQDLTWREEVDAKAELHRIFQELYGKARQGTAGGHTKQDTADYLGKAKGGVIEDINLSDWAKEIPEVAQAKTRSEALKTVKRLKESAGRQVALDKARAKVGDDDTKVIRTSADNICTMEELQDRLTFYSSKCAMGSFEDTLKSFTKPFDLVIWDPPWGVDFDTVAEKDGSKTQYKDSVEAFNAKFLGWTQLIYDSMAPDSHLYLFFGIVNHAFVYDTLERVGFETNRMPLIWHKEGVHRTRNPKRWPGRCYEPIAFAHKGSKPIYKQGAPDIIKTKAPTPKMKSSHPSAKHPAIIKELLERSAKPGDRVLDPMAGSGMTGVAAEQLHETLNLDWRLIELSQEFFDLILFNLAKGYPAIVGDTDSPVQDLPEDYKTIEPGTALWTRFWEAHPELHEEMTDWRLGKEK